MNITNPILQNLMNQLQTKSPQGFQMVTQMMNNGGNPQAFLQQILGKTNPQQMQSLLNQAKSFGVPDNVLSQIQNMGKK